MIVYFVRHGKTDYSQRNTGIYQGWGVNLSPLAELGVRQIKETAQDPRLKGTELILSSPYTRALQSAAILSRELGAEIAVETDLHEWKANWNYVYEEDAPAEAYYQEYEAHHGCWPEGTERPWESAEQIRQRVLPVLERYRQYRQIVVACHGMLIQAVTGQEHPAQGGIVPFYLD